jgi:LAO/AO transport system kinase
MTAGGVDDPSELVARARTLDKRAIALLVDRFEDTRPEAAAFRGQAMADLKRKDPNRRPVILGITGTPGSGKSSLLARVVPAILAADPAVSVAVVGIDPSSRVSKGALLGDRTRMQFSPGEARVYMRSQASASILGGLAPASFQVCALLTQLFDATVVETVGIGQSELDIQLLADHVCLVLQPLGGDEIQFLKAGIVEIPDTFVLNKCDDPSAARSYHQLLGTLSLARPFEEAPDVLQTSARTGEGIEALASRLLEVIRKGPRRDLDELEILAFDRWVRDEWGRAGSGYLESQLGGATRWVKICQGYERAQAGIASLLSTAFPGGVRTPGS